MKPEGKWPVVACFVKDCTFTFAGGNIYKAGYRMQIPKL